MENNDIIELLDILYGMVNDAWGVPLGNDKCIIEREKAIQIINDIKSCLPTALAESKRLVSARDEFIGNAKREAEALRKTAEEKARAMVEEQEIVRQARARSAEMISTAEAKSREVRRATSAYVEDLMRRAEDGMSSALKTLYTSHEALRNAGIVLNEKKPAPAKAETEALAAEDKAE